MNGNKAFGVIAESTRIQVQHVITDLAGTAGDISDGETAALFWAQLSGAITAIGNGLSGLVKHGPGFSDAETMKRALHEQLDSAMKETANDPR